MSNEKTRNRGFDVCKILQTGHITYVNVKESQAKNSYMVSIGVRSSVGLAYDKEEDDNNEVTIFWTRYYKDEKSAQKFADLLKVGKYVIVMGNRQDYNVYDNREKNYQKVGENYLLEEIKWGVDFEMK